MCHLTVVSVCKLVESSSTRNFIFRSPQLFSSLYVHSVTYAQSPRNGDGLPPGVLPSVMDQFSINALLPGASLKLLMPAQSPGLETIFATLWLKFRWLPVYVVFTCSLQCPFQGLEKLIPFNFSVVLFPLIARISSFPRCYQPNSGFCRHAPPCSFLSAIDASRQLPSSSARGCYALIGWKHLFHCWTGIKTWSQYFYLLE